MMYVRSEFEVVPGWQPIHVPGELGASVFDVTPRPGMGGIGDADAE